MSDNEEQEKPAWLAEAEAEVIEDAPEVDQEELVIQCFDVLRSEAPNLKALASVVNTLDEDVQNKVLFAAKSCGKKGDLLAAMKVDEIEKRRAATEERGLLPGKDGAPLQNFENARRVLASDPKWEGVFFLNTFDDRVWVGKPLPGSEEDAAALPRRQEDADIYAALSILQSEDFPNLTKQIVHDALNSAAHTLKRHPINEYLRGLVWDKTPRLHMLFRSYFPCEVDPALPDHQDYLEKAGQRFCIGAVARVMNPGSKVDHMPVISSGQGQFKSTGFEVLCGKDHFGDDMPPVDNKDAKDWMRGKWVAEIAEMASMTGKDIDKVKSFLSTKADDWRKPYGYTSEKRPRQTVFAGTVNGDQYLVDDTGGRRFWPMRLLPGERVRVDDIAAHRDQLWAEAVVMYDRGEVWWFDQGECPALEITQEDARFQDVGEELVRDWLQRQPPGTEVQASTVAAVLFPHESTGAGLSRRIGRYIKSAGWVKAGITQGSARYKRGPKSRPFTAPDPNVIELGPYQGDNPLPRAR